MKTKRTERGFAFKEFSDLYGSECSIQKSSLATNDAIWFGVDKHFTLDTTKNNVRMHLDKKLVKKLIPILQNFVKTGEVK